jgi:hypothetical protein
MIVPLAPLDTLRRDCAGGHWAAERRSRDRWRAWSWAGPYLGLNIGYSAGKSKSDAVFSDANAGSPLVAAAVVTKNSVVLTDPIVVRGAWPDPTSVDVATGPQPPPPLASRKPATSPMGAAHAVGASRVAGIRQALNRMKPPITTR